MLIGIEIDVLYFDPLVVLSHCIFHLTQVNELFNSPFVLSQNEPKNTFRVTAYGIYEWIECYSIAKWLERNDMVPRAW